MKNQKKKVKTQIPKTVQESIPYVAVYKNGIIETISGRYTKTYALGDCNFLISSDDEQESIFALYQKFLNMFPAGVNFQVNLFNRKVDDQAVSDNILIKHNHQDGLDDLRDERNEIILKQMSEGKNNLVKERYITVSINAADIDSAASQFNRLDVEIAATFKKISDKEVKPMTLEERLAVLYDIYNPAAPISFLSKATIEGKQSSFFDIDTLNKQKISTKDILSPASIEFKNDHIIIGDKYARVLFIDSFPSILSTSFFSDMNDTNFNFLSSVSYEPMEQEKTMKLISNQITNINASIVEAQKKASRGGYSTGIISPTLAEQRDEANQLRADLQSKNQKTFYTTVLFVVYGDNLDELNDHTNSILTIAAKHLVAVKKLNWQQEYGFDTALPLGDIRLNVQRLLTTEQCALFLPFSSVELSSKNGIYYGLNTVTKNLIMYDRYSAKNTNGIILGVPGSGKSFTAKREMIDVLLNTNDDVFVVDPEREYAPMSNLLKGETIRIAVGGNNHINPLDMDINYADEDDPVSLKSDFVLVLIETMMGATYGLSAMQNSIIDRCVRQIYAPYLEYMRIQRSMGFTNTIDREQCPTLVDLYNALLSQPEPEARAIALALELYAVGSLDTFAKKTNVDITKRFVVYDIKDVGTGLKEIALQVCLNDIWNRTISNSKKGRRTRSYYDEFHILVQTSTSAKFMQQIFKRSRKWQGCPTGITQNVEDMLNTQEARTIVSNSEFVVMLNQSPIDCADLASIFNINKSQTDFITNVGPGQGLIWNGHSLIPFIDKYPTDTKTYAVMTTKPGERMFA